MQNYTLKSNETILFRGTAHVLKDGKPEQSSTLASDLILTNYNIVLITEIRKLLSSVTDIKVHSVEDVKIYDQTVQVIQKKKCVDIYLTSGELFLEFDKLKDCNEFCDKAIRLIAGNSKFVRAINKMRKTIKETDEALDIDLVDISKKTALTAANIAVAVGSQTSAGKTVKLLGTVAKVLVNTKNKSTNLLSDGKDEN